MKTLTLRHAFPIGAESELVSYLIDFEKFGTVHPLIRKVVLRRRLDSVNASYDVSEEAKLFGWLKMKPRYRVHVQNDAAQSHVTYRATIMGIMRLKIHITWLEEAGILWVIEQVEVSSILLLTRMFLDVFEPAHLETFARMRQAIAA